jgi:serine protease Do
MTGRRTASEHSRDHSSVLRAFRSVVAGPSKSTVRVLCDDKQVALGAVVDSGGYIATKGSELNGPIECELADGTRHQAELVGIDRGSDLAVLKIAAEGLPTIRWSEEDPPGVGGWVVTPGLGDLPQAIGVVSVAPHRVRGGVLGIRLTEDQPGPRITFVVPGSGAAKAGLSRGDIITHVNAKEVKDADSMVAATSALLPGDKITLKILRSDRRQEVEAVLGSVSDTLAGPRSRFQDQLGGPLSKRRVLFPSALEHDSVLRPNQCGGPLIDLDGTVVGINIARANRISSYAIPAKVARPLLDSLKDKELVPVATEQQTRNEQQTLNSPAKTSPQ